MFETGRGLKLFCWQVFGMIRPGAPSYIVVCASKAVQTGFLCLDFGLACRAARGSGSGPVHDLWSGWVIAPIFSRPGSTTHHDMIACMSHRVKCNFGPATGLGILKVFIQ